MYDRSTTGSGEITKGGFDERELRDEYKKALEDSLLFVKRSFSSLGLYKDPKKKEGFPKFQMKVNEDLGQVKHWGFVTPEETVDWEAWSRLATEKLEAAECVCRSDTKAGKVEKPNG